jgi:nucleotide-binding universal stress UspA family protein
LSVGSLLRSAYLLHFSQPAADRALYKALRAKPIRSIVELGISLTDRTRRLLEVAAWRSECLPLRYTGIDLFEGRGGTAPGLTLKQAHAALRLPNVRVQLVPGDPHAALARVANALTGTDLLVIAANQDRESLALAWSWLPRMLTPKSLVFLEESSGKAGVAWRQIPLAEVQQLAARAGRLSRRAA